MRAVDLESREQRLFEGGGGRSVRAVSRRPTRAVEACRVSVLGSGSGGNSTLIEGESGCLLIDAGFGPRTTQRRLGRTGLDLGRIRAVCLTHLDRDHFRPTWIPALLQHRITLYVDRWRLPELLRLPQASRLARMGLLYGFDGGDFDPLPGVHASTIPLPHDHKGTSGFRLELGGVRIGYATDLGAVPASLVQRFAGVDLLAIESNYDPAMQAGSDRPLFLKRRIMGGAGHLSNEQAFDLVRAIDAASPVGRPERIVLLHRSAQCNTPQRIAEVFGRDPWIAKRVTLTEQRRRSPWIRLRARPHRDQLPLAFSA